MTSDRVILIFGATGGIGSCLARRLHGEGARLALSGRNTDRLASLSSELDAPSFPADATVAAEVDDVFAKASETLGPVTGVAHCVGSILLKPAHLTSDAEWAHTLTTSLTSAFLVVRAAARQMARTPGGSVVLVSSVAGQRGLANHEAIAAAKSGVEGLVRSAAASYARQGLRFNAVAPGLVRTPLTASITSSDANLKLSTALHPLGRIGTPEDIAAAIAWLLSPEQSWITGQVLGVDGGMSTVQSR
jgi:NAD(P)-dependent dehydrogenase (short-subunit alcohol dehydrogenase family)